MSTLPHFQVHVHAYKYTHTYIHTRTSMLLIHAGFELKHGEYLGLVPMKAAVPPVFASCSLFPPFLITLSITSHPMYNALNPVPSTIQS